MSTTNRPVVPQFVSLPVLEAMERIKPFYHAKKDTPYDHTDEVGKVFSERSPTVADQTPAPPTVEMFEEPEDQVDRDS